MAADYKLNADIQEASERIQRAAQSLARHFPLSETLEADLQYRHRNEKQTHRHFYETVAALLETLVREKAIPNPPVTVTETPAQTPNRKKG